jgi:alpha-L-rhamnosidase
VTGAALARNVELHRHLTTGFVGTPYLLHALTAIGRLDLAYRLLLRRAFPSWLYPVVEGGATTIWERWDGWRAEQGFFDPEMNSFNHYAYGCVAEWLYGTVAGLDLDPESDASGWRRARLAPRPPVHPGLPEEPRLTSARARLDTVNGRYQVSWTIENGRFRFDARVPAGCAARLELPDGATDEVSAGRHTWELDLGAIRGADY